jgi:hypothetical protein
MRQPSIVSERIAPGWDAARLKMSSSRRAASSHHGTMPGPRAASAKDVTAAAGPLIVRW